MRSKRNKSDGISVRFLLLHPAVWFVFATGTLIYLGIVSWGKYRDRFLDHDSFILSRSIIEVNPAPTWADSMLQNSLQALAQTNQSLLDPSLIPNTREYLATIPWIRRIERMEKSVNGLALSLQYRKPVAILDPIRRNALTVDGDGVVFDESVLEPAELARIKNGLLRINMPQLDLRNSLPWHTIVDARILPATRLAEYLTIRKDEFELYRLVTRSAEKNNLNANPQFELWTINGTTVIWGSAPGDERPGEATAKQKIFAINEYVSNFGDLKTFDGRNSHAIDVTTGAPVVIKYERIALKNSWLNAIK